MGVRKPIRTPSIVKESKHEIEKVIVYPSHNENTKRRTFMNGKRISLTLLECNFFSVRSLQTSDLALYKALWRSISE